MTSDTVLNVTVLRKWVERLESGEVEKCTGGLKTGDRMCATGVLCDLHGDAYGHEWEADPMFSDTYQYMGFITVPPIEVDKWLGTNASVNLLIDNEGETYDLVSLNDDTNLSLPEIGALIRQQVLEPREADNA